MFDKIVLSLQTPYGMRGCVQQHQEAAARRGAWCHSRLPQAAHPPPSSSICPRGGDTPQGKSRRDGMAAAPQAGLGTPGGRGAAVTLPTTPLRPNRQPALFSLSQPIIPITVIIISLPCSPSQPWPRSSVPRRD